MLNNALKFLDNSKYKNMSCDTFNSTLKKILSVYGFLR